MSSVWTENMEHPHFEPLGKNIKTDVLIIGGGLAGILCAHRLKNEGIDCVLAESKNICGGVTQNTTAKITFQHGAIYDQLIKRFGKDKARLYLEAQKDACREYGRLSSLFNCDYEIKDSYVYSIHDRRKMENEVKALRHLGEKAFFAENIGLPFDTAGAVLVKNQAEFHPLKFAFAMAEKLPIYENTKILELKPNKAITAGGEIAFKKVIIATHFPILNKHGSYFLKMYQHRSYVIALRDAEQVNGMYVDERDSGLSFRNYGDLLLIGGGAHRTGKKGGNWHELEAFARKYYPYAKIVGKWAAQDCMTLDGAPYIGEYSRGTKNIYTATGFNKWGITSSMAASMILTDLILGKSNRYAEVFSPSRSMLRPQLAINAFESVFGLLTPTVPRCPHLGCALKYNPDEHSWDCPCHGSRFTANGELIDNPSTDDKKMK